MGLMRILDATGDTRISWSVDNPSSVEHARTVFNRHLRRGVPFARRSGQPAGSAQPIAAFDPGVEEIIWTRPVTAG